MPVSRSAGRWCSALGPVLIALFLAGCRPAVESTPEAVPLLPLGRDPMEDGVGADRWPGWRGRNSAGIAPAGSPAIRFGAGEGFRWRARVPGEGWSSPVVWDDCVLLTSAVDKTDPATLQVLCFDRAGGRLLWQADAGKAQSRTHVKNGYASATVATDGERIFAFFGTTGLFCYDFSGEPLWRADLGDLDHQYGTASSPVLFEDAVIQLCDSAEDSYLAAFDRQTGRRLWRTPRPSYGCWTTPVLVQAKADGSTRTELVVNGAGSKDAAGRVIVAYDPDDGRALWRVRGTNELVTPTLLVGDGLVYSTSGRNGATIAIRPGGTGDVTESRVVWKVRRGGPYNPSGVLYRNRLYLVDDAGTVTCYNAGDGQPIWKRRLRGPFTASLVAADGRIYATNERGTVYVFTAADSFELLAENEMKARCLATPAIAGGELFVRTETNLYCIPNDAE